MTRICVSTFADTVEELSRRIEESLSAGADLVEARLDYLERIEPQALKKALAPHARRLVATLRPEREGGRYTGPENQRLQVIRKVAQLPPGFVDVELDALSPSLCRGLRSRGARIIASSHDLKTTPRLPQLNEVVKRAMALGDIAKVVTQSGGGEDNLRVMQLYTLFPRSRLVAFCMGELGKVTRLLAMAAGSPIAYASLDSRSTAAGQLELGEMKAIRDRILREKSESRHVR